MEEEGEGEEESGNLDPSEAEPEDTAGPSGAVEGTGKGVEGSAGGLEDVSGAEEGSETPQGSLEAAASADLGREETSAAPVPGGVLPIPGAQPAASQEETCEVGLNQMA